VRRLDMPARSDAIARPFARASGPPINRQRTGGRPPLNPPSADRSTATAPPVQSRRQGCPPGRSEPWGSETLRDFRGVRLAGYSGFPSSSLASEAMIAAVATGQGPRNTWLGLQPALKADRRSIRRVRPERPLWQTAF
jgi:hypothetical protein